MMEFLLHRLGLESKGQVESIESVVDFGCCCRKLYFNSLRILDSADEGFEVYAEHAALYSDLTTKMDKGFLNHAYLYRASFSLFSLMTFDTRFPEYLAGVLTTLPHPPMYLNSLAVLVELFPDFKCRINGLIVSDVFDSIFKPVFEEFSGYVAQLMDMIDTSPLSITPDLARMIGLNILKSLQRSLYTVADLPSFNSADLDVVIVELDRLSNAWQSTFNEI